MVCRNSRCLLQGRYDAAPNSARCCHGSRLGGENGERPEVTVSRGGARPSPWTLAELRGAPLRVARNSEGRVRRFVLAAALLSGCASGLGGGAATFAAAERSWPIPAKPYSGQFRPDGKGQCPRRSMTLINGGCWWKVMESASECVEEEDPLYYPLLHLHKGACYVPAMRLPGPATSLRTSLVRERVIRSWLVLDPNPPKWGVARRHYSEQPPASPIWETGGSTAVRGNDGETDDDATSRAPSSVRRL